MISSPSSFSLSPSTAQLIAGLSAASNITWLVLPEKDQPLTANSWSTAWRDFQQLDQWLETTSTPDQAIAWDELSRHPKYRSHLQSRWQPVDLWAAVQHVRFLGEVSGPAPAHTLSQIVYAPKDTICDPMLGVVGVAQLHATVQRMDAAALQAGWISLSDHLTTILERITSPSEISEHVALVQAITHLFLTAAPKDETAPACRITRDWPLPWLEAWATHQSGVPPQIIRSAIWNAHQLQAGISLVDFPLSAPPSAWTTWAEQSEEVCQNTWTHGLDQKICADKLDAQPGAWAAWMNTLSAWPWERAEPLWPSGLRLLGLHTDIVSADASVSTMQTWIANTPRHIVRQHAPAMATMVWSTAISDIAVVDAFDNSTWAIADLLEWMHATPILAETCAEHAPEQVGMNVFLSIAGLDPSKKSDSPLTSPLWDRIYALSESAHPSIRATLVALAHAVGRTEIPLNGASTIPMAHSHTHLPPPAQEAWIALEHAAMTASTASSSPLPSVSKKM